MIRLIAAIDRKRGIAKNGVQPWFIPDDEKYFLDKVKTHGAVILRGRQEFAIKNRPIHGVRNVVASHEYERIEGVEVVRDLDILNQLSDMWVIGGASIFEQTIDRAGELYLTLIEADFGCDLFFPEFEDKFRLQSESEEHEQNGFKYKYTVWEKY